MVRVVLGAAIKVKLKAIMSHDHYGKQKITGMSNFSNPGKVEMYSHRRSDLPLAMAFAFLHC